MWSRFAVLEPGPPSSPHPLTGPGSAAKQTSSSELLGDRNEQRRALALRLSTENLHLGGEGRRVDGSIDMLFGALELCRKDLEQLCDLSRECPIAGEYLCCTQVPTATAKDESRRTRTLHVKSRDVTFAYETGHGDAIAQSRQELPGWQNCHMIIGVLAAELPPNLVLERCGCSHDAHGFPRQMSRALALCSRDVEAGRNAFCL